MMTDSLFQYTIGNRKDFKIRDDGTNMFIYEYKKGIITELNETARYVWTLIDGNETQNISALYAERYGIPIEHAEKDVTEVLEALVDTGILKRV
ncbi:PqqD family protein [Desulfobacca acetoxidans]